MTDPCTIQLFGGLRLRLADRTITRFRTQKTGALLAYLAYHRHHSHAREVLIEMLWPDTEPESGRHNLSHALSSLRSLLAPPGVPAGSVLVADRFTVGLNPAAVRTDVADFDQALRAAARARNAREQESLLTAALDTVTGPLLPGYYEDWIQPAQEYLTQRVQQAAAQRDALREKAKAPGSPIQAPEATPPRAPLPNPPPTGTVTVLMTHIEGSAALGERADDAFNLLRHEFRRNGGYTIQEAGDTFLVVFASVGDALAAALASQRALDKQPLPEDIGALKVRMALHTGDVESDDGEYHGPMLQCATRMLAAAHGGQILCSEATAGLLRRDLEPEVRLKDLGLWRLRDLPEPERLFQMNYPEQGDAGFPPLNASPAQNSHLPLQFTRFFGRETEIQRIGELLAEPATRLLTLTGPGGTGKTRLSLESVGRFAQTFTGAIWFVPLADLSEPGLIPQAIVQAMGIPLSGSKEPMEQAVAALSQQPTLLILDNVEQLVAGGAEVVQSLLRQVATLQIVATSRQLLGLPGEIEFAVAPLPTPNGSDTPERLSLFESVRLFVDRAQIAKPDFRITNANAPALAELCDRLEGIPLAIELAAARALVLTPSQMLSQLSNRFEFLVSRKRGIAERQRTLRAAIDWSYRLLAPDLQRFFAQLSVFRGGWSLEAAEAVCDEPMALDMLAQLRESSLVTTQESEAGIRFRMLEMLRVYAAERLSAAEMEALRKRHAAFMVALAEETVPNLKGPEYRYWVRQLDMDHDNFRAALAWCSTEGGNAEIGLQIAGAIFRYWHAQGHKSEGRRWLATFLSREPDHHPLAFRARALLGAGTLAWGQDDLSTARAHLEASLAVFQAIGERSSDMASALRCLGNLASIWCDSPTAMAYYAQCLAIYRERGDRTGIARTLANLAYLQLDQGDLPAARAYYAESLAINRALNDLYEVARSLRGLGEVAFYRGDHATARAHLTEALEAGSQYANYVLAQVEYAEGNTARACTLYQKFLTFARSGSDQHNIVFPLEGLAGVLIAHQEPTLAAKILSAATRVRAEIGFARPPITIPGYERQIARIREALGDDAAFDRAWRAGRELTLEQAVGLAWEGTKDISS